MRWRLSGIIGICANNKGRYRLIPKLLAKESTTREIRLPDDNPAVVEKMIQYLYSLDYSVTREDDSKATTAACDGISIRGLNLEEQAEESISQRSAEASPNQAAESHGVVSQQPDPLILHIWIYALADRLLIPGLKALSRSYFYQSLEHRLDTHSFGRAIEEVYCSTPSEDRRLRDLVKVTLDHLTTLTITEVLCETLLKKVPDYASDLCMAMIGREVPPSILWPH